MNPSIFIRLVYALWIINDPHLAESRIDTVFQKVDCLKGILESGRVVAEVRDKTVRELIW